MLKEIKHFNFIDIFDKEVSDMIVICKRRRETPIDRNC